MELIFSRSKLADAEVNQYLYLRVDRIFFKILFHFQHSEKFYFSSAEMLKTSQY